MIFFQTASAVFPVTMLVGEIAPGLTRGFISGAPLPTTVRTPSTAMIELKRAPVASTPMRFSTASSPLLLDHLSHREDLGDRLDRDLRHYVTGGEDTTVCGDHGRSEEVRVDFREGRNVVGVFALLERSEFGV